jgi:hypothetical protein
MWPFCAEGFPLPAHIGGGFFASMKCNAGSPETAKKRASKVR